ncbi:MAG: hypothetical protein IPI77_19800 [Saprospiraceae bacterium]|nr:hypothetical protein [Saprospiraceae bacterium]
MLIKDTNQRELNLYPGDQVYDRGVGDLFRRFFDVHRVCPNMSLGKKSVVLEIQMK